MARRLIGSRNIRFLSLDDITWNTGTERKPFVASRRELLQFIAAHDHWIIEGCYSDLVEVALPHCTELRFLNPGIAVCIEHCTRRPWEPTKFLAVEEQQKTLEHLIQWVRAYETRDDEYGLTRHRKLFDDFTGRKKEYTNVASYYEGNEDSHRTV